ncbi:MAG TPA: Ig-like domain-containing protein [Vicinamibacterales bacterium]
MTRTVLAVVCLLAVVGVSDARAQTGTQWYVSPGGSSSDPGTKDRPMSLTKALSSSSPAKPGDTIWLRGGVYAGSYVSSLEGTASAPIRVRQYPGERAILDANNSAARNAGMALLIQGAYTWFMDFEVTHTGGKVDSGEPNSPSGIVFSNSRGIKLINLVIHDLPGQGIGFWASSIDSEAYGCLFYYNGINSRDHGIYAQNTSGTKRIVENFVFANAGYGLHLYASGTNLLNNFHIEGNTVFNNGAVREPSAKLSQVVFGGTNGSNNTFVGNYTYSAPTYSQGENTNFGYGSSLSNSRFDNNVFALGSFAVVVNGTTPVSFSGNRVVGSTYPSSLTSTYSGSSYYGSKPSGTTWAYVRPNRYVEGRANITVYNWSSASQVSVNLSNVLAAGDTYEIRDVQNFFGSPVASGTYSGGTVVIPMTSRTTAVPAGRSRIPEHTPAEFGAFVVLRTSGGGDTVGGDTGSGGSGGSNDSGDSSSGNTGGGNTGGGAIADTTPPVVAVTAPASGSTVSGEILLRATATDNVGIASVQFRIDGAVAGYEERVAPYETNFNTASLSDGKHTVTATARDAAGNTTTSAPVTFTVSNSQSQQPAPSRVLIRLEAESGTVRSPMTKRSGGSASGQYVYTTRANSGSVSYQVDIPRAGTYVIWARVYAPNASRDSFEVSVDGQRDIYDVAENRWADRWQWTVVNGRNGGAPATLSPRTFQLTQGRHTIVFAGREANTYLDQIVITDDLTYIPE